MFKLTSKVHTIASMLFVLTLLLANTPPALAQRYWVTASALNTSLNHNHISHYQIKDHVSKRQKEIATLPRINTNINFILSKEKELEKITFKPYYLTNYHLNNRTTLHKYAVGAIYTLSYDAVCASVLYFLPCDYTHWSETFEIEKSLTTAFTEPPVWDNDVWYVNYLGHPYQGAFYYNSIRSQGISKMGSFSFAVINTFVWEYLFEGVYERPSINDLIVTPILGSILGEATHQLTLRLKRNGFTGFEKAIVILTNPTYAIQNGFKVKQKHIP